MVAPHNMPTAGLPCTNFLTSLKASTYTFSVTVEESLCDTERNWPKFEGPISKVIEAHQFACRSVELPQQPAKQGVKRKRSDDPAEGSSVITKKVKVSDTSARKRKREELEASSVADIPAPKRHRAAIITKHSTIKRKREADNEFSPMKKQRVF